LGRKGTTAKTNTLVPEYTEKFRSDKFVPNEKILAQLFQAGLLNMKWYHVASILGISRETLNNARKEFPELNKAYSDGVAMSAEKLLQVDHVLAARGVETSLKRQLSGRGYNEAPQVTEGEKVDDDKLSALERLRILEEQYREYLDERMGVSEPKT